MKLVVISHKLCWADPNAERGFATDGGFPMQMEALSELFCETKLLVPCLNEGAGSGLTTLKGHELSVLPMTVPIGQGLRRKASMLTWLGRNSKAMWREVRNSDAVHTPIPGDIGTIGLVFALLQRKPLFVRHCGNWLVQRTVAERFWKWSMERFAGGRNVMLATGGTDAPPSRRNSNVKWIFSTSLRQDQLVRTMPLEKPVNNKLRLIIACRQEVGKGTDVVIGSLPLILKSYPGALLDVVGDGSALKNLKKNVERLGLMDQVTFHGKVPQSQVLDLLQRAHVFCYPTASEGFPKVVLEALASGLPVVTTKVSVLPHLIGNGCGILLDEPTPTAIAIAVESIFRDADKYREFSKNAISTARQYTLENWRDSIGETLRSAWGEESLGRCEPRRVL